MESHTPYLVGEFTVFRPDGTVRRVVRVVPPKEKKVEDTITMKVRDRDGHVISEQVAPMRSFVKNFAVMMCARFGNHNRDFVDTSGATSSRGSGYCDISAAAGNTIRGIWVGTDDGSSYALAPANYRLGAKIAHGSGSGQLDYKLQERVAVAADGSGYDMEYFREFENLSGSTIIVKETCLVGNFAINYMVCRDIKDVGDVAFNQSVLNGQTAESRYKFGITQNSGFVKNYLLALDSSFWNSSRTFVDVFGGNYGIVMSYWTTCWEMDPGAGDSRGLWLGSNDLALSCDHYNLATKITNGTGAGQLVYGAGVVDPEYIDGNNSTLRVRRTFTNNSGSGIDIKECGMIVRGRPAHEIMIGRLLTGTINLQASETIDAKIYFIHPV